MALTLRVTLSFSPPKYLPFYRITYRKLNTLDPFTRDKVPPLYNHSILINLHKRPSHVIPIHSALFIVESPRVVSWSLKSFNTQWVQNPHMPVKSSNIPSLSNKTSSIGFGNPSTYISSCDYVTVGIILGQSVTQNGLMHRLGLNKTQILMHWRCEH